ncbi:MAG: transporter substrate-binding domain-containing protein, partial [Eggerthellaceae bacterium]|nr:transporter substrate-binding domain-containing protein [Eggerthellaceae bacterium]
MFKKIVVLLTVCMLAVVALVGCGGSQGGATSGSDSGAIYRTLDQIKESGTIVIGVFSDKNPFGYVDENGEYAGYDIELAERLAKDLGVEVEYVSTEAASRVEYLETGKVDVVLANFTVTHE